MSSSCPVCEQGSLRDAPAFGKYRIVVELGRGGMGVVYLAHDTKLHRRVALKVLPAGWGSASDRQRLRREASLQARAEHEHVVMVYELYEADGHDAIAMEYIRGRTLADHLSVRGRLSPAECLALVGAVIDALAHVHEIGIVHRDLKPANVMLTDAGDVVKVADFGLARSPGDQAITRPGAVCVTLAYASPETLLGQSVDHRSDLYALGATLFELLTGRKLFVGGDHELVEAHKGDHRPAPSELVPGISPLVDAVVRRAVARDPAARYQDAREMKAALTGAIAPPVPPPHARRWRGLLLFAAIAGTALAAAGALARPSDDRGPTGPRELVVPIAPPVREERPAPVTTLRDRVLDRNPFVLVEGERGRFAIQRTLVSIDEYGWWVGDSGDATTWPLKAPGPVASDAPARWVTYEQSQRFCAAIGARLVNSREWAAAAADERVVIGPLAEWTGPSKGDLALIREPGDRAADPADPLHKTTQAGADPGADANVVADSNVGLRCAH